MSCFLQEHILDSSFGLIQYVFLHNATHGCPSSRQGFIVVLLYITGESERKLWLQIMLRSSTHTVGCQEFGNDCTKVDISVGHIVHSSSTQLGALQILLLLFGELLKSHNVSKHEIVESFLSAFTQSNCLS